MPRPRSFDETTAVQKALLLFWRRGYPHTGVRDLCTAMGIQSGSFYSTFTSKAALFDRAVDQYVADLRIPAPSPAAAVAYLHRVIAPRDPAGCLLALSCAELTTLPEHSQQNVQRHVAALDAYFASCLPGRADDARMLSTVVWGLQLQHRVGTKTEALRRTVEVAMERLDLPTDGNSD